MRSTERHMQAYQQRKEKAQQLRDEQVAKLKQDIAKLESVGACATFEEFKESTKSAKKAPTRVQHMEVQPA
ncbi:hypothetical protein ON010_g17987 [Phytophthora cinnamomi]|nr:hypothetical protein ON010_g17987 [Phytophthora cinnamomi]